MQDNIRKIEESLSIISERIDEIERYARQSREKVKRCRQAEKVMIRNRDIAISLCNKRLEHVIEENSKLNARNVELKRESLEVLNRMCRLKRHVEELETKKATYKKRIKQLEEKSDVHGVEDGCAQE